MRIYKGLNFREANKICMKKVAGVQGLALQHHFP